jgi:hypothetical protein
MKIITIKILFSVAMLMILTPINTYAQRSPVLAEQPESDGTTAPRDAWGRADLNGVWDKAIHLNIAAPVEPLQRQA